MSSAAQRNLLDALGAVAVASPVSTAAKHGSASAEDEDLKLARILQEQERAFFLASLCVRSTMVPLSPFGVAHHANTQLCSGLAAKSDKFLAALW